MGIQGIVLETTRGQMRSGPWSGPVGIVDTGSTIRLGFFASHLTVRKWKLPFDATVDGRRLSVFDVSQVKSGETYAYTLTAIDKEVGQC